MFRGSRFGVLSAMAAMAVMGPTVINLRDMERLRDAANAPTPTPSAPRFKKHKRQRAKADKRKSLIKGLRP
jgi:hypothetical protein